jgi:hypothetical protein
MGNNQSEKISKRPVKKESIMSLDESKGRVNETFIEILTRKSNE